MPGPVSVTANSTPFSSARAQDHLSFVGELRSVGDQVEEHLEDPVFVADELGEVLGDVRSRDYRSGEQHRGGLQGT